MATPSVAEVLAEVPRALEECARVALCQIVRVQGSTPGKTGWKMLVRPGGATFGNLGGGSFEAMVRRDASRLLETSRPSTVERYYLTEDSVKGQPTGMVCGGMVEVLLEVLAARPVLVICGGGPVGQALARQAAACDFEVAVADDREDFRQPGLFPAGTHCVEVSRGYDEDFVADWRHRELFVAVVSRCWETDLAATASILRSRPESLRYLGLMGSRRKIARVTSELEKLSHDLTGVPWHAPIGLAIGGTTPAEIAVSIAAEMIQERSRVHCERNRSRPGAAGLVGGTVWPMGLFGRSAVWALVGTLAAGWLAADGWREAPLYGADVRSLAFDPAREARVLAGTSSGQIYESLDFGRTWRLPAARVALAGWVVSELQFDPNHEGRVWAALWALWGADGAVVVSNDGGRTWESRSEGLPARQVYTLALATDRADELFAATRDGVWGSRDAGRSWRPLTAAHPRMGKITSLLVDPHDPAILYAGSWQRAYRSDDRGITWRGIFEGMVLDSEVFSLVPGPGGEGELWASTCGWVYRSRNRGGRWQRHTNGLAERRTPSFEALTTGRLLAGTVAGVYSSDDRGASWRKRGPKVAVNVIAAHPSRPELVLIGSEGSGVWRSSDGGGTFETASSGLVGLRVTDVVANGRELTLSVRHAESNYGIHRLAGGDLKTDDAGELPTVLDLAADGAAVYAATERGVWRRGEEGWHQLAELGSGRVEAVAAAAGWIAARTRDELVSSRQGAVARLPLADPVAGLVVQSGAIWFVDDGRLWRWDLERREEIEVPGTVSEVGLYAGSLVVDTGAGRFQRRGADWAGSEIAAPRMLPTGDDTLPYLGLWSGVTATLHDAEGRQRAEMRLPVPSRDVSAVVLRQGRLHLATAGYGLIWSHLLELVEDERAGLELPPRISSR